MPIINKGIFEGDLVYARQTGNDWPTAQVTTTSDVLEVSSNLYFTAARANAAIYPSLTTANVIETSANLYFTVARVNATVQPFLTTANVVETAGNLYYTNARANAAIYPSLTAANIANFVSTVNATVQPFLTTANVVETSANLYFTDARANAAIYPSLTAANIANFISTVNATVQPFLTTANVVETSGNLYFTVERVNATVQPFLTAANIANFNSTVNATIYPSLTTANVTETSSNLYFTNSRVISALIAGNSITIEANGRISANTAAVLSSGTTDLLPEGTNNLYYTNSRVISAVNPLLTTANVTELTNLYFTNARARTALTGGTGVSFDWSTGAIAIGQNVATSASVTFYNVSVTNNLTVYGGVETFGANNIVVSDNMIYLNSGSQNSNPDLGIAFNYNDGVYHHAGFFRDASDGVFKVFDNYSPEPDANIFIDTSHASFRVANIQATTLIGNITGTAGTLDNFTTTNLKEGSNLYFTVARVNATVQPFLTTANVIESPANLYFTVDRVNATVQPFLTTANVVETSGNLYFTNVRVIAALSNATITGNLTVTDTIFASNFTGANLTVNSINANTTIINSITANSAIFGTGFGGTLLGANLVSSEYFQGKSWLGIYTANVIESPVNLYFTVARVNATVQPFLTTANVVETSGNLYFTNARVVSALIAGQNIIIESNGRISANISATTAETLNLTTANVAEASSNLYFTVARVNATIQPFLTTANVVETFGNLYFTNARVVSALIAGDSITIEANGRISANVSATPLDASAVNAIVQPFLTTANVVETSSNLYFTNARVLAALVTANVYVENLIANSAVFANAIFLGAVNVTSNILSGSGATFSGDVLTGSVTANIWNRLYTANVIETSGNLYYTNARARTAFTAGAGVVIDYSTGTISANVISTIINSSQIIQSTGANTYTLNVPIATPQSILVIVEGLVQIPSVDYTVSGTTLTLSDYPAVNSNIEIRYYGVDSIYQSSSIYTKVDSFIGTGSTSYTLSLNPPSKDSVTVIVNGVYRQSDQYSINNKILTFNSAPALGANVDIRIISGIAGTAFNTRTYTANGTSNTFVITDGFTQDTILVFENGVTQVPGIDYTVVGNNVYLATAPAANIVVQIRELGVTGLAGGTTAASIRGYDLTTGNVIPTIDVTKNLGSSTFKWDNSYVNQSYVTNVLILGGTTVSTSGSSITLVSNGVTTTLSGPTQSSRAFGLALIFGG